MHGMLTSHSQQYMNVQCVSVWEADAGSYHRCHVFRHAPCVEALVQNGASPLALDSSRHNTALHWAASCCRSDCVQRLLASSVTFQMQSGEVVPIARIPCYDEDNRTLVKLVDRHNGWGLTALHLAVFKGSTSTGEQQ